MNFPQFLAFAAYSLLRRSQGTLHWSTVQQWIAANSKTSTLGLGYALGKPGANTPRNSFVELIREQTGDETFNLIAAVYLDRNQEPCASKTWGPVKFDRNLREVFGKNLRTRIRI